jgi:hypothetical protein
MSKGLLQEKTFTGREMFQKKHVQEETWNRRNMYRIDMCREMTPTGDDSYGR